MHAIWSYALAPFGLLGMIAAGKKWAWGWVLSTFTQFLWISYAIDTQQWGFIPGSVAYGFVYIKNWWAWRK